MERDLGFAKHVVQLALQIAQGTLGVCVGRIVLQDLEDQIVGRRQISQLSLYERRLT